MIYLNLHIPTLFAEVVAAEPIARATWMMVNAYCSSQENGGRIVGARSWKDRRWQQACAVTLQEVEDSAPLLTWDGDDLLVSHYDLDAEANVRKNRKLGRRGGKKKTPKKVAAAQENGAKGGRFANPDYNSHITQAKTQAKQQNNPSENPTKEEEKEEETKKKTKTKESPAAGAAKVVVDDDFFAQCWNGLGGPFPQVRSMVGKRHTALRERLKDAFWRDNWQAALEQMSETEFCRGRNDRNWIADVDFFLRPDVVAKIIEGKYGERTRPVAYFESDLPESDVPMPELLRQRMNEQIERRAAEGDTQAAEFLKENTP